MVSDGDGGGGDGGGGVGDGDGVVAAVGLLCSRSFQRTFLSEVDAPIIPFCRSAN